MSIKDFIAEFNPEDFPPASPNGRWIGFDQHDPPFTVAQLRKMATAGIIELDLVNRQYCLRPRALSFVERKVETSLDRNGWVDKIASQAGATADMEFIRSVLTDQAVANLNTLSKVGADAPLTGELVRRARGG